MKYLIWVIAPILILVACSSENQTPEILLKELNAPASINGIELVKGLKITDIRTMLGDDSRIFEHQAEKSYIYDNKGILFVEKGGSIEGVAIIFNSDGDQKMPRTNYVGSLVVGGKTITAETTISELENLEGFNLDCGFGMMCMTNDRSAMNYLNVIIENDKVIQFDIGLSRTP